jgi:hypothetical protein
MINNNHSIQLGNEPLLSKEELSQLTTVLTQTSAKIDTTNQVVTSALKQLDSEQATLKQEIIKISKVILNQQKTLTSQSKEIAQLKQQISEQSKLIKTYVSWPTVIAITLLAIPAVVGSWFLVQKIVPVQFDSNTLKKIDILYDKYLDQKQTKSSKRMSEKVRTMPAA